MHFSVLRLFPSGRIAKFSGRRLAHVLHALYALVRSRDIFRGERELVSVSCYWLCSLAAIFLSKFAERHCDALNVFTRFDLSGGEAARVH